MTESGTAARRDPPTDAATLAPMAAAFGEALDEGLAELRLLGTQAASPRARSSYEAHARLLREWNAVINLTAIREPAAIARRHVCDSLSAAPPLAQLVEPGSSLLDVGSGAGYPGLPLAAALPWARVGLLDSIAKKARFLAVAAAAVSQILEADGGSGPRIEAITERAEDLAEEPDQRGAWDVVSVRAVGSLAEVVELGLPLARVGGVLVAWKREEERGGLRDELRDAGSIIRATGGGRPEVVAVESVALAGHRLVFVPKQRPTPASYPRPAGRRKGRRR